MASLRRSSKSKKSRLPLFPNPEEFRALYESQWNLEYRREYLNQWAQSPSMSPPSGSALGPRSANMCNAPHPIHRGILCRAIPANHAPPCWGARLLPDGKTEVQYWTDRARLGGKVLPSGLPRGMAEPIAIPALPVEKRSIPILAWKSACLNVDRPGKEIGLYSGSVSKYSRHQIVATAECVFVDHEAPAVVCSGSGTAGCGFYGVMNAGDVALSPNSVILEVEFSGRIIVHEEGYRAAKQRILAVEIPEDGCEGFLCTSPPTQMHFPIDGANRAVCDRHAPANGRTATLDLITEHLGIPVRFGCEE